MWARLFTFNDSVGVAALTILAAAATCVTVSDKVPSARRLRWRYPVAIVLIASADITLAVIVAGGPDQRIGLILLLAAVLLGYGVHRRIRVTGRP